MLKYSRFFINIIKCEKNDRLKDSNHSIWYCHTCKKYDTYIICKIVLLKSEHHSYIKPKPKEEENFNRSTNSVQTPIPTFHGLHSLSYLSSKSYFISMVDENFESLRSEMHQDEGFYVVYRKTSSP